MVLALTYHIVSLPIFEFAKITYSKEENDRLGKRKQILGAVLTEFAYISKNYVSLKTKMTFRTPTLWKAKKLKLIVDAEVRAVKGTRFTFLSKYSQIPPDLRTSRHIKNSHL